jgi:hypothetical protein
MELKLVHELNDSQVLQLMSLYQHAWWSKERTIEDVREMLLHTDLVFGFISLDNRELVAFARVLSDYT